MPLTGTRDLASLVAESPLVPTLDTEPQELSGARILQIIYEIDEGGMTSLLPAALHPTIPPTVLVNVTRVEESPWGRFTLAECRIGCRQGARPRALLLRAVCDSPAASEALRSRWGYPVVVGEVSLEKRYDRITAAASTAADGSILKANLMNPEPISGNDIQYISGLHLARVIRDGVEAARLVQVDPDYVFHSSDRGQPQLVAWRAGAWGFEGAEPIHAVSASYAVADVTLPHVRYLVDPTKPPLAAVERV